ncbi:aminotransferase class V-fold PLP-dependent enzyme [Novosphingobium sp. RD2P27]|uniref:Cysteine desulfurase n=1 Tax=Novosphingobium kalidii TaxID=3230299 RepID=A0ABV2CZ16_9SPHN
MPSELLYLDHAATAPMLPDARSAWLEGAALWANPSSPHRQGRAARAALEDARERVKVALGWEGEVVFTSGASEAVTMALSRCVLPVGAVSAVEHDAVLRLCDGVPRLGVDAEGRIDSTQAPSPALVAVQHVNNETGVVQEVGPVAQAVREAGGLLLSDCAQSAAKLPLPDADLIAISAHKFGGPVGIGALLVRDWAMLKASGGQERGYRAGTENLPGVLSMVAALEASRDWLRRSADLRAQLEQGLIAGGASVIAQGAHRVATIGAYRMPGVASAVQLIRFDAQGIAVSAGSACSSGSLKASHVLTAMGVDGAGEVIRVSVGRETNAADIDRFVSAWTDMSQRRAAA